MIKKMIVEAAEEALPEHRRVMDDLARSSTGEDPDAMAEFGQMVKCSLLRDLQPGRRQEVQGLRRDAGDAGGPLEIAARPDEFKCPGCGTLNRKGARICGGCRKHFCVRCKIRVAVLRNFCHTCVPHLRR
jgi:hypothetical protein